MSTKLLLAAYCTLVHALNLDRTSHPHGLHSYAVQHGLEAGLEGERDGGGRKGEDENAGGESVSRKRGGEGGEAGASFLETAAAVHGTQESQAGGSGRREGV